MPKRVCTNRAEWRLVRGKSAQHLSAHYQLECDYGTVFLAIYNEGDAVYLCESHASSVRSSEAPTIAGVRLIEKPAATNGEPVKGEEQVPVSLLQTVIANAAAAAAAEPETVESTERAFAEAPIQTVQLGTANLSEPAVQELYATAAAASTRPETARPAAKTFLRDLTYGDCAKALVDEAIWNLEPGDYEAYKAALFDGKTVSEAAQAAGGQLAIVLRRIGEYATKLEGLLSESKATIDVSEAIDKPLEQAMLDIIGDSTLSDAEKDRAIDQLGALQKEIDGGLGRAISALQAHRITIAIAERAKWGTRSNLDEELKPAYGAVYTSVRNALVRAVPEARVFDERLANLYAAKSDIAGTLTLKAQYSVAK